jgi:hypothetical protein
MPVEPDLGAVVDAGEIQCVGGVPGRGGETGAIPPILFPQVLWNVEKV